MPVISRTAFVIVRGSSCLENNIDRTYFSKPNLSVLVPINIS